MFSSLCATSHLIKPLTSTLDCPIVSLLLSENLQIYYLKFLIYSLRTTNYRSNLAPSHEVTEVAVEEMVTTKTYLVMLIPTLSILRSAVKLDRNLATTVYTSRQCRRGLETRGALVKEIHLIADCS